VEQTWAQQVAPQKLLVVGVNGSAPGTTYKLAPKCEDGHVTNPGISCKEATLLTTGYELGADWVIVVGSDNYVFPRSLEKRLKLENPRKAQILGIYGCGDGQFCEDHKSGLCGGGGYAISRGALDEMVGKGKSASQDFIQESMHTASTVGGYWSDQVTSCIARRHGVKEVQLEGLYGWKLCPEGKTDCSFDEEIYKERIMALPKPLTFHYMKPDAMRRLHEMVVGMSKESFLNLAITREVNLSSSSTSPARYDVQRTAYIHKMNEELNARRATDQLTLLAKSDSSASGSRVRASRGLHLVQSMTHMSPTLSPIDPDDSAELPASSQVSEKHVEV